MLTVYTFQVKKNTIQNYKTNLPISLLNKKNYYLHKMSNYFQKQEKESPISLPQIIDP